MAYKDRTNQDPRYVSYEESDVEPPKDFRALGVDAVRKLGDISFRTAWMDMYWTRGFTTSLQRPISLPDAPGAAMYIKPNLRRLCAAADENAQGLWATTVLVGSRLLVDRLLQDSLGFRELYNSSQGTMVCKDKITSAFAMGFEDPGLQLVCFDSMSDATDELEAADIVRGAKRTLRPGGLLVMGGTLQSCTGRQGLAASTSSALKLFDLVYEQERPLNGGVAFQKVFRK